MANNPNLPYTRFRNSDASHVGGVEPIARDERALLDRREESGASYSIAERITRRRRMSAAEADAEIATWTGAGAAPVHAPAGWRAWERTRRDAVTGGERVLRIAISDRAPHDVVNWSAPAPLARGDNEHWRAQLPEAHRDGAEAPAPPGRVPFLGWTA